MVDTNDDFDVAKSTYVSKEDIKDCLVAFIALDDVQKYQASDQSNAKPGETLFYDFVPGALVVVAGTPSKEFVAEYGKTLPALVDEFGFSGVKIVDKVKKTYKSGRPVVGRLRHVKNKRGGYSFVLEEATPEDLTEARKHKDFIRQLNEMHDKKMEDDSPFDE